MWNYKKYLSGFLVLCAFLCSEVISMQTEEIKIDLDGTKISGKSGSMTFRSIANGDEVAIAEIVSRCEFKEGFPANPTTWAQNLITRQEEKGNPYSGLVLESPEGKGFLCFGRMTTVDYDPKFTDIIETYLSFGITKLIELETGDKYAKSNIARVGNRGLGLILPILPESMGSGSRKEALKIGLDAFQFLKNKEFTLPIETTVPTHLIGLFHPEDSLIPLFESAGFDILRKEGFFGYYDKPRVMAHIELK
jgi:hypothetical protein